MTNKAWGESQIMEGPPDAAVHPELSRGLLRAISNTAVSVLYQDASCNVIWSLNVPPPWADSPFAAAAKEQPLTEDDAARLAQGRKAVLETGEPQMLEVQVRSGGGTRWFDVWMDADRDENDRIIGLVTTSVETTDHKRREQTLRALLREVSHRSKNLLAIILSIAAQTGRYSGTIDAFLLRFRGRIQSLAASQDLVTLSNWRGAELRQLVRNQLGRYCADPERNIRMTGENPYLNPNAALHVGLALHELAVNSVSYGALARTTGLVTIDVQPATDGLDIVWCEKLNSTQAPPSTKRFGSVALERIVPAALDGSASLQLEEDQVRYRLFVPATNFELA